MSPWPLPSLRLSVADLTLRPVTESDLDTLGALLPDDIEQDPAAPRPFGVDARTTRVLVERQQYWRHLGAWTPSAWRLPMIVLRAGEPIGMQELEGKHDFLVTRTVDSSSWLVAAARGQGVGKAMRTAVLALAFEGLDALVAESEAWHDNAASLGVSRSLGYVDNGAAPRPREGRAELMVAMRLASCRLAASEPTTRAHRGPGGLPTPVRPGSTLTACLRC